MAQVRIPSACLVAAALLASVIPAAAQKIVFESTRDGNFEIYSMNADGTGLKNLTNNSGAIDRVPQWSPDGTKIAFVTQQPGQIQDAVVIDADGSNLLNLTKEEEFSSAAFPQWSPDGTRIAYNSNRSGTQQIYVMNADGTDRLQKTNEGVLLSDARWSPSGGHIAYAASRASRESIIVMDTVNFNPKENLTLDLDQATDPRWSPDGTRIAFTSRQFGDRDIYVMNADGSGKVNLTSGAGDDKLPVWSPDAMRILFGTRRDGNDEVYSINVDGSGLKNLTNHANDDGSAQWSPDGSRIVFSSNRDGGDLELYIMNADGTNQTRLTNAAGNDISPQLFGNFSFGQPPAIFANGVILANLAPKVETISPLSIISIFGMDFSSAMLSDPNLDSGGKVDTILGGTCVEIGGERAPIFAMFPTQANVQTPGTPNAGPVPVVVIRDCDTPLATRSNVEMVTVEEATPGFFIFNPIANSGFIAARFNATETQAPVPVAPTSSFPNDSFGPSRPAKPGDIILLYGTGWGPTDPSFTTGELASGAAQVLAGANPSVTLGGVPLAPNDVLYVGVTPNTAGLFQLAIRIPEGTTPGNKQVVLTVYGKSTPLGPVIP